MSIRQYFGNSVLGTLPATRMFAVKRWLLRFMGVKVAPTTRVTSSLRIWGRLRLVVGDDTFLGHQLLVSGGGSTVTIGNCVDIGPRVTLVTGTHTIDMQGDHSAGAGLSRDICIEDGAWIGAGVTVIGGVTIGRKAVIAAGSVVTDDIPEYSFAAGVPCRVKKMWDIQLQKWAA